jgi:hypothetical protein
MARLATLILCATLIAAPAGAATTHPKTTQSGTGASKATTSTPKAAPDSAADKSAAPDGASSSSHEDASMTLHGGQEGTVFKSLTIEGEDRIRLDFERPELKVDLDPMKAPGLDWGSAREILDRTTPDLATPLVAQSAHQSSPYLAHPWLSQFASGAVARFRPNVQGVESWKLSVVDARGATVATYQGRGEPPHEIAWDGRSPDGAPVVPGLTYSYVLEAHDKAGNKRNFVGEGFKVGAYRLQTADGPVMVLSAKELPALAPGRVSSADALGTPPILIEAASWLNQLSKPNQPIRMTATARSRDEAQVLADFVTRSMQPYLIGDPTRVQTVAQVQADAPEGGTIRIASAR